MLHAAVYHFDSDVQSLPVWGAAIFEALGSLVGAPLVTQNDPNSEGWLKVLQLLRCSLSCHTG